LKAACLARTSASCPSMHLNQDSSQLTFSLTAGPAAGSMTLDVGVDAVEQPQGAAADTVHMHVVIQQILLQTSLQRADKLASCLAGTQAGWQHRRELAAPLMPQHTSWRSARCICSRTCSLPAASDRLLHATLWRHDCCSRHQAARCPQCNCKRHKAHSVHLCRSTSYTARSLARSASETNRMLQSRFLICNCYPLQSATLQASIASMSSHEVHRLQYSRVCRTLPRPQVHWCCADSTSCSAQSARAASAGC
jgi:hypothetical protein